MTSRISSRQKHTEQEVQRFLCILCRKSMFQMMTIHECLMMWYVSPKRKSNLLPQRLKCKLTDIICIFTRGSLENNVYSQTATSAETSFFKMSYFLFVLVSFVVLLLPLRSDVTTKSMVQIEVEFVEK